MKKTQDPDGIERRARQGCGDGWRAARPEPRPMSSAQLGAVPERVPPAHPSLECLPPPSEAAGLEASPAGALSRSYSDSVHSHLPRPKSALHPSNSGHSQPGQEMLSNAK